MLFRNLRTFDFTGRGRPRTARLIEQLEAVRFEPCRPHQPESIGWVAPDGSDDGPLVLELGDRQLFSLCVEQRAVPAAVVREEVTRRAKALAREQGRPAGRREITDLRDAVIADLRPRAFSRIRRYPVMIDAEAGLVLTDAVTAVAADRLVEAIRNAFGALPLKLPGVSKPPAQTMTRWLKSGKLPPSLVAGTACVLRDVRNRQRTIRLRGAEELGSDVAGHIAACCEVIELELLWADRLQFRLAEDLTLRGVRLIADEDADEASVVVSSDAFDESLAAEFAASALVESAALMQACVRLRDALGVG